MNDDRKHLTAREVEKPTAATQVIRSDDDQAGIVVKIDRGGECRIDMTCPDAQASRLRRGISKLQFGLLARSRMAAG